MCGKFLPRLQDTGHVDVSYFGHPCYGRPGDTTLKYACVYKCRVAAAGILCVKRRVTYKCKAEMTLRSNAWFTLRG